MYRIVFVLVALFPLLNSTGIAAEPHPNPHVESTKKYSVKVISCGNKGDPEPECHYGTLYAEWVLRDFPATTDEQVAAFAKGNANRLYDRLAVLVRLFRKVKLSNVDFMRAQQFPNEVVVKLLREVESGALSPTAARKQFKAHSETFMHYSQRLSPIP